MIAIAVTSPGLTGPGSRRRSTRRTDRKDEARSTRGSSAPEASLTSGGRQSPLASVSPATCGASLSSVKQRLSWMCHCVSGPPMSGTVFSVRARRAACTWPTPASVRAAVHLVDERLGMVGIEDPLVVDVRVVDEVLGAGEPSPIDLNPSLGLVVLHVRPLRQPDDGLRDQVLCPGLLGRRHAFHAAQVDRLLRVIRLRRDDRRGHRSWSCR